MKIERQDYDDIRNLMEEVTGKKMMTPKDFDLLVLRIYDVTHMQLSLSTMKRFWGYVDKEKAGQGEMRLSTLNIFANYVGYTDWEAFCKRNKVEDQADSSSAFYGKRTLEANQMRVGQLIRVIWNPDRSVIFRCTGNNTFIVIESQNSKLSVGDTFTCPLFVEHLPLTLINLIHNNNDKPCGYVCGKSGGITFHYPLLNREVT